MCCGVNISETEEPGSRSARRRMEIHQFHFGSADSGVGQLMESGGMKKRRKIEALRPVMSAPGDWIHAVQSFKGKEIQQPASNGGEAPGAKVSEMTAAPSGSGTENVAPPQFPKFGMTSVCGRRRDMEDAVAIHPSFCGQNSDFPGGFHFFGVFDGHGCSHVSTEN